MLVLKPFTEDHGRSMVHSDKRVPTSQVTCASWGCRPPARIHVRLLGPCFKTGRMEALSQHRECAGPKPHSAHFHPRSPCRHGRGDDPRVFPATVTHVDQRSAPSGRPVDRSAYDRSAPAASIRFPLNNFKHFLTLFSKFFSSFPRGTCSLSVSRQYLALDGIYHPIRAAFPNNPTR